MMLVCTCDTDLCVKDVSSFSAGSHFAGEGSKPHIARVMIPQYMILEIAQVWCAVYFLLSSWHKPE